MSKRIAVGAVAYDPKVVTIWEMINDYFRARGIANDYVLYSNYEAQVEAQIRAIAAAGATDLIAPMFPVGADATASLSRTRALLRGLVGKV